MADIGAIIDQIERYNENADTELIRRAYDFAAEAHKNQKRLTGEPYITHPLATARVLADLEMDSESIAAALLHDVVEDQDYSVDDIERAFGKEIAALVDGVTKLRLTDFEVEIESDETEPERPEPHKKRRGEFRRSAENLRKIFLAMARDLRVMVIKLADRLHNMTTLDGLPEERRLKVAQETMQIYAPLAHRLGVWELKWQLEDLAFKYLYPEPYEDIVEKIDMSREDREEYLEEVSLVLTRHLADAGIDAHIQARPKHLWSIYLKLQREEVDISEIYDLSAVRVIVNRVDECYHALGIVHDLWIPIPERFTDFIARPKSNMYQSLHTKVLGPHGEPLEIQIRTWNMHRVAEFGVAAHWQYKERTQGSDEFERKLSWLRQQLFDWETDNKDSGEFLRGVISDLFADQVFVFTPRGDVVDLPAGSTPVDFAYRIHSDVGSRCVGGKVNGRIVPLTHKLSNGDIVEIITRSNSQPSLDWLSFVKTAHARNRIKNYFRKLHYDESVDKGRETLDRELQRQGQDMQALSRSGELAKTAKESNFQSEDDLFAAIGFGHVSAATIANKFRVEEAPPETVIGQPERPGVRPGPSVTVDGVKDLMVNRAKCCSPLPGEEVVGYVTRGKGITLHKLSCPNVRGLRQREPDRLIEMQWPGDAHGYRVDLKIKALDRVGLLNDVTAVFSEAKTNIAAASIRSLPDKTADLKLTVEVRDAAALNELLIKVGSIEDVLKVERASDRRYRKSQ